MASYVVQNFGCRATQAEGAAIERDLLRRGLKPAGGADLADVVVVNTCTVTAAADYDARAAIRRIHRANPGAKILVTGCYAQRAPEELAGLPGVSWVIGNSHKHKVADVAANREFVPVESLTAATESVAEGERARGSSCGIAPILVGDIFAHAQIMAAPVFDGVAGERTRPNLKVQDGCDNRCSFCVIPSVRGQSRSLPLDRAVEEMLALTQAGYREVVLSGINLGRWGRDLSPASNFPALLRALLDQTGIERLRISSVEPMDWSDELIDLVASSPRIAKHAHLPLQSGSDRVLRRMHRKYRPWHYAARVRKIREAMPDAAIGADVMVGFPGESEEEFEESKDFIARLPFTYLHVFSYSPRPGTPAAAMPQQVSGGIVRERNRMLREIAAQKNLAFRRSFVGREISAITLSAQGKGCTDALSENYLRVAIEGSHPANQMVTVELKGLTSEGVKGEILSTDSSVTFPQKNVELPRSSSLATGGRWLQALL